MHPQTSSGSFSPLKLRVLLFLAILSLSACFIMGGDIAVRPGATQASTGASVKVPLGSEKRLENSIPRHLPIKVKVNNLDSGKWAHDLEVVVTNTSNKPIYFLDLHIILPEIKSPSGPNVGFPLRYGRIGFVKFTTPVEPDDVPIQRGGTHTFKIATSSAKGLDYLKAKGHATEPKRIQLIFQVLNFGDGTGYADSGGTPIDIRKPVARNATCAPPPRASDSATQPAVSFLPASFLPVKFSMAETFNLLPGKTLPRPDINCPGTNCSFVKLGTYVCSRVCDPNNPEHPSAVFVGSGDPEGACRIIGTTDNVCMYGNTPLHCTDTQLYSCSQYSGAENSDSTCSDGVDNDGDGQQDCDDSDCAYTYVCCPDQDSDGYTADYCGGTDCDDFDAAIYPGCGCVTPNCTVTMYEGSDNGYGLCASCYDGVDNDCNGYTDLCDYACIICISSPIVIDVLGDGFRLTNVANGVAFDINGDGTPERLSWTAAGVDDAWLALDRNANGKIDNGQELFGNFTPQPPSTARNGFSALAEYDKPENGGNRNGVIDAGDAIFFSLRLWQDVNHNGVSEADELHSLRDFSFKSIDLDYKESKRTDEYGNRFRYRAKVKDTNDAHLGRWAWDVFLLAGQ